MINSVYRLIAPGMIEVACTQPDIKNSVILRPLYLSICKADQRYYLGNRSREALKAKLVESETVRAETQQFMKNLEKFI